MPSKPALIRQSDVTRVVKGFAAAGITVGATVKNGEVRFVPVDEIDAANEPSTIAEWRAQRNARKAGGRA